MRQDRNSNYIKGDHASEEAWIIVDLGEETNIIESLTAEYFNLVYPTDYDVLVSADKEKLDHCKNDKKRNRTEQPIQHDEIHLINQSSEGMSNYYSVN